MKKWSILIAGMILQLIIGGIYAWSVFSQALNNEYGFTGGQTAFIFGFIIAVFTLSMVFAGKILHKLGPSLIAGIGSLLFGSGYILASFAGSNYIMILLSLGLLTGSGTGFIYICPLSVSMQWFPKQKGLVTGLSVAGFGGGAVLLSSFASFLLTWPGIQIDLTFRIIGIVFGLAALTASFLLKFPPEAKTKTKQKTERILPYVFKLDFILLTLGIFSGTFAGLLVIGNLKPILLDSGVSDIQSTLAISLFAVGNAAGRIFWGRFFDRFGMRFTILLAMSSLALGIMALALPLPSIILLGLVFFIGTGFGSCFTIYALSVEKCFGQALFSQLYPIVFLGYGMAAISGPAIGGGISDLLNSYTPSILKASAIIITILIIISLFLKNPNKGKVELPE